MAARINVQIASQIALKDDEKEQFYLENLTDLEDWEPLSLLSIESFLYCTSLMRSIDEHNEAIERAQGVFGSNSYREEIKNRLQDMNGVVDRLLDIWSREIVDLAPKNE